MILIIGFGIVSIISLCLGIALMLRVQWLDENVDGLNRAHGPRAPHMHHQELRDEWNRAARNMMREIDIERNNRISAINIHEARGHDGES